MVLKILLHFLCSSFLDLPKYRAENCTGWEKQCKLPAYLEDIMGLVLDHCNTVYTVVKNHINFRFEAYKWYVCILYCSVIASCLKQWTCLNFKMPYCWKHINQNIWAFNEVIIFLLVKGLTSMLMATDWSGWCVAKGWGGCGNISKSKTIMKFAIDWLFLSHTNSL